MSEAALPETGTTARPKPRAGGWHGFSPVARTYLVVVAGLAGAWGAVSLAQFDARAHDWLAFGILACCSAIAQRLVVPIGHNHGFPTAIVFLVAAAILLPAELAAMMGVAAHSLDLAQRRYPWYIQAFNISNYTVNTLAARAAAQSVASLGLSENVRWAGAALAVCLVLVALNHLLLAMILRFARGHSFRESGLFSPRSLFIDLVLAALGVALAKFWFSNPYLIPIAVAPLALIHRSFSLVALLRTSEQRFRAMFEAAAIGTALMDLEGRIVSTNRAFEEMLGYSKDQLEQMKLSALADPEEEGFDGELHTEMLAGERDHYRVERCFVRADGTALWGQATVSLVRDADDQPAFTILMVEDMTERKQLEDQLRHAQKMEAVGRLAGGVAHDFNNLLTVIGGHSRFVLDHLRDEDAVLRKDVEGIIKSAERAASLTGQLLAFSRRQVLQPRILDLNAAVADMDKMLRRLLGEDVAVVTEFEPGLGRVKADPGQIEQVIVNLVINARDAMPAGGRITLETANVELDETFPGADRPPKPGTYVKVSVRDTGTGMDEGTRSRIFEPFFTTKERGKGTGLGLSTVYGIIAQSGGYLGVDSEPGRGSTFSIYLPLVARAADSDAGSDDPEKAREGSETVLLVEDDDGVRGLARRALGRQGYTVLEAFDGAEALRVSRGYSGRIDLLVTDVIMPELGGKELVERLCRLRPELRVLYMSGYTDGEMLNDGVSSGEIAFLQKPFTEHDLAEKAREVLDDTGSSPGVDLPMESQPVGTRTRS